MIGSNGHGKSNFIDCIFFVLTEKYLYSRQEDKKFLLHEDMNNTSEDANIVSIEIVLDNKKKIFPVDSDSVSIVKTYNTNSNKEEMKINNKKLLKADVNNLLESAGFNIINPYYFVQQGKINRMVNMNDSELFDLFSEVIGIKTFEEKKIESLKLLEQCKETRNKILKQKDEISEYIKKFNVQCDDLKEFNKLEEKKKVYEAFIYKERIHQMQVNTEFLEERKKEKNIKIDEIIKKQIKIKDTIKMNKTEIENLYQKTSNLKNQIERCNDEIINIEKYKYKSESDFKYFKDSKNNIENNIESLQKELKIVNSEKEKCKNTLNVIEKKQKSINKELEIILKEYNEVKSLCDYLLLNTSGEKNKFINTEIQKINVSKQSTDDNIINIQKEINKYKLKIKECSGKIEKYEDQFNSISKSINEINKQLIESKNKRKEIVNNIKKNEIELHEIKEKINQLTKEIDKSKLKFPSFELFNSIIKLINLKIPGLFGIFLDLFEINPKVRNAVDLILKDKLYTIICDTEETSRKIIEINKKNDGPVISIIPLEYINDTAQSIDYQSLSQISGFTQNNEQSNTQRTQFSNAKFLIDFIKINNNFIKKFPEISIQKIENILIDYFSKCLLVKNFEIGMKYAKELNLDCVTSDNEIIYKGAFITKVGYYDFEKQRCNLYENFCDNNKNIILLNDKLEELNVIKNNFCNDDNNIIREQQELFKKKNELNSLMEEISNSKNLLQTEISNCSEMISYQNNIMENLLSNKNEFEQKLDIYNQIQEGKLSMNSNKSKKLLDEIKNKEKQILEITKKKNELQSQKIELESKTNNILKNKQLELESKIQELQILLLNQNDSNENIIEISDNEIKEYKTTIKRLTKELQLIQNTIEKYNDEIRKSNELNNSLNSQLNVHEGELKKIELNLKDVLEKKEKYYDDLVKLGYINTDEFEKLKEIKEQSQKALANESGINVQQQEYILDQILIPIYQLIEKVNFEMKKFDNINRFALDDYNTFTNKKKDIDEKIEDLSEKEKKILDVLKVLNEKKENTINITFQKLNTSFRSFFKELIPYGDSSLELSLENQTIHININMTDSEIPINSIYQLSGGQKTAVGISLVFALSHIESPPFYVLDEIDSALDSNIRLNFYKLIRKLGNEKQFIITSFKSELIDVADNIYLIKFANKTSNIAKIEKEEAINFLLNSF